VGKQDRDLSSIVIENEPARSPEAISARLADACPSAFAMSAFHALSLDAAAP
jgi:hypothetical protein